MKWLRKLFARKDPLTLLDALQEASKAEAARRAQEAKDIEAARREEFLTMKLAELAESQQMREAERAFESMANDLIEARAMAGAGPWRIGPEALKASEKLSAKLHEAYTGKINLKEEFALNAGAYGDWELALMTIDWRRELNFSILQFSRWGIQQIILLCRLYYMKNPIPRRLIDVVAAYVFARGVEVTTSDETANDTWKEFVEDNAKVFGQIALTQAERTKATDGNLYWCFFPNTSDTGKIKARMIDATEIQEIHSNPDDSDEPWYYLRIWTQETFNVDTGAVVTKTVRRWYPAMNYEPDDKPEKIRDIDVEWKSVVHHRKCGYVGKWIWGCPWAYPMMDWAKEARRYLEACASVAQQLAQIALTLTTKGGQQALMGAKQQLGTTVGPYTQAFDSNPPTVSGGIFAAGAGTKLEAFKTQGAGCDPEGVRQFKLMCCMVAGVPETFLADVSTGNLATATSLDRPTETSFLERQEAWVEDLTIIAKYVLKTSAGATNGKLSEAKGLGVKVNIVECRKKRLPNGRMVYEAFRNEPGEIETQVNFPDIREGDMPAKVAAIVKAITLDNKAGQAIGIDLKAGVIELYDTIGMEGGEEKAEEQFPKGEYEVNRTKQIVAPPLQKPQSMPGGQPEIGAKGQQTQNVVPPAPPIQDEGVKESLKRVKEALNGI